MLGCPIFELKLWRLPQILTVKSSVFCLEACSLSHCSKSFSNLAHVKIIKNSYLNEDLNNLDELAFST